MVRFSCAASQAQSSKLINSLVEKDGLFQIDLISWKKTLWSKGETLCFARNPHNPGGRVWDREVLEKSATSVKNTWCLLVSD